MSGGRKGARFPAKPVKLDDVRNEINVTPLVDVVLVLLIIMMVIGPMLARGHEVKLPQTQYHLEPNDNHEPIVAIDQYGKVWVDKEEVPAGGNQIVQVQERVQQLWQELRASNAKLPGADTSGETRVLLKVSPAIPYGQVYPFVMALNELGATGIDLGTEELKE